MPIAHFHKEHESVVSTMLALRSSNKAMQQVVIEPFYLLPSLPSVGLLRGGGCLDCTHESYKVSQEEEQEYHSSIERTSFSCVQKHIAQLIVEARPLCTICQEYTLRRSKSESPEAALKEEELGWGV